MKEHVKYCICSWKIQKNVLPLQGNSTYKVVLNGKK